jgi:uncharacterized protein YcbX
VFVELGRYDVRLFFDDSGGVLSLLMVFPSLLVTRRHLLANECSRRIRIDDVRCDLVEPLKR